MIPPDIFPWSHRMIFEYFEIVRIGFFSSQSNNNYKSKYSLSFFGLDDGQNLDSSVVVGQFCVGGGDVLFLWA